MEPYGAPFEGESKDVIASVISLQGDAPRSARLQEGGRDCQVEVVDYRRAESSRGVRSKTQTHQQPQVEAV